MFGRKESVLIVSGRMKKVGLTGGIGSGKSVVAQLFEVYGIPVYNSDQRSKELCETNEALISGLQLLLGEEAYTQEHRLNRAFMAAKIFESKELLQACNRLIHPIVIEDFTNWSHQQNARFVVQESAILFEAGLDHFFDEIVSVVSPEELRLKRVCERSGMSAEDVLARMRNQLTDEERIKRSHYILINDGNTPLIPQVESLMDIFIG